MIAMAHSDYVLRGAAMPGDLARFMLWIDLVGAYMVCTSDEVAIGGPPAEGPAAEIALLANLSRKHATIARSGERYVLKAHAPAVVAGRPVHDGGVRPGRIAKQFPRRPSR